MTNEMKFEQILYKFIEDSTFRDQLLSDDPAKRRKALSPYFPDDPEKVDKALAALDGILDSPHRDSFRKFLELSDPSVEYAP